jgi:glycosyltransferase involved in cell wall biosynthesis
LVTGQSKSILSDISRRFPSVSTWLLSNGVDTRAFRPDRRSLAARSVLSPGGEFVVLYAGLLGLAQGLDQVLEAAKVFGGQSGIRFVFIGDGPERESLLLKTKNEGIDNVVFLGSRSAGEMPSIVASADLLIVPLKGYIPGAVPSKLYEAMASGRPLILVAAGEAAEIVRTHDCGVVVPPGDIAGLACAIAQIRSDPLRANAMGANGRVAAVKHYDRHEIAFRFERRLQNDRCQQDMHVLDVTTRSHYSSEVKSPEHY